MLCETNTGSLVRINVTDITNDDIEEEIDDAEDKLKEINPETRICHSFVSCDRENALCASIDCNSSMCGLISSSGQVKVWDLVKNKERFYKREPGVQ